MNNPPVDVKVLNPALSLNKLRYATPGSAGLDLLACIDEALVIDPGACHLVPCGFALHMKDPGLAALVLPRSGLGHRDGIVLGNLVGLIDSDYQGEIMVSLWNRGQKTFKLNPMDRMAQLVFVPVIHPRFEQVDDFERSDRAEGGFGSTGVKEQGN